MQTERLVPVVVKVVENGQTRTVRVGQAVVSEGEVTLSLDALWLQLNAPEVEAEVSSARPVPGVHVESRLADLEWLAQRSRTILSDPKKSRWHEDMRAQLSKIEAEMDRLRLRPRG